MCVWSLFPEWCTCVKVGKKPPPLKSLSWCMLLLLDVGGWRDFDKLHVVPAPPNYLPLHLSFVLWQAAAVGDELLLQPGSDTCPTWMVQIHSHPAFLHTRVPSRATWSDRAAGLHNFSHVTEFVLHLSALAPAYDFSQEKDVRKEREGT